MCPIGSVIPEKLLNKLTDKQTSILLIQKLIQFFLWFGRFGLIIEQTDIHSITLILKLKQFFQFWRFG